ncbi:MAG: DUF4400 domain-containing protein [Nitrococcus mobilis]|nr:DUF4400 domain-containing protein [Nitrococcus mobilis]
MAQRHGHGIAVGLFITGAIVIELAVLLLFVPSARVAQYNANERAAVAADLGLSAEARVRANAKTWYRVTLIEPGFVAALNEYLFQAGSPKSVTDYSATNYVRDRLATFWRSIYAVYYRLALIWLWVPYLLPLILPTLIDAVQARRVRQWRFSYVSPLIRALATKTKWLIATTLGAALLLPLHVPALAYPFLFGVLMLANWVWVANLQKRI